MSNIEIYGLNIHYEKSGILGKNVLLLHGWGQNTQMMAYIENFLSKHFVVYNIDFPGFGQSSEPDVAWDCDDYTSFLHEFCVLNNIDNPIIIGHSFGCRIALRYAYKYGAYKMVLTGAAGLKNKHNFIWYIKTYSYKLAKKILPKDIVNKYAEKVGSNDYKNTSGVMRQTFVKVVNSDVKPILKDIKSETLLVFGEYDDQTPVDMGKTMEKLMPNATLVVFEKDDHFAYFNQADRFNRVLDAFLRSDY